MTYQLIHGDCLDVEWPQVDAIITDVPYGVTACKWDSIIPFEPMWAKIKSSLKSRGAFVTTASQPFTSALVMSNPKWFKYEWIWEKTQSRGHLLAYKRPMMKHENLIVFSNGQTVYNPIISDKPLKDIRPHSKSGATELYNNKTVMQVKTRRIPLNKKMPESIIEFSNAQKTVHPTQKPVALYEYLIKTYTNEGDTVLDFCFGSCTTGVACINTGRNFIGIEKDEKYFEIGQERMRLAQK